MRLSIAERQAIVHAVAEKTGSALDNLNRAEKLGVLWSARDWLAIRQYLNERVFN